MLVAVIQEVVKFSIWNAEGMPWDPCDHGSAHFGVHSAKMIEGRSERALVKRARELLWRRGFKKIFRVKDISTQYFSRMEDTFAEAASQMENKTWDEELVKEAMGAVKGLTPNLLADHGNYHTGDAYEAIAYALLESVVPEGWKVRKRLTKEGQDVSIFCEDTFFEINVKAGKFGVQKRMNDAARAGLPKGRVWYQEGAEFKLVQESVDEDARHDASPGKCRIVLGVLFDKNTTIPLAVLPVVRFGPSVTREERMALARTDLAPFLVSEGTTILFWLPHNHRRIRELGLEPLRAFIHALVRIPGVAKHTLTSTHDCHVVSQHDSSKKHIKGARTEYLAQRMIDKAGFEVSLLVEGSSYEYLDQSGSGWDLRFVLEGGHSFYVQVKSHRQMGDRSGLPDANWPSPAAFLHLNTDEEFRCTGGKLVAWHAKEEFVFTCPASFLEALRKCIDKEVDFLSKGKAKATRGGKDARKKGERRG